MTPFELYEKLNVKIFKIVLNLGQKHEEYFFVHPDKTLDQWRKDLKTFYLNASFFDIDGYSSDKVLNKLFAHMNELGYFEIDDVITDIFEGKITNDSARLIDDPSHESMKDGFGHYGFGLAAELAAEQIQRNLKSVDDPDRFNDSLGVIVRGGPDGDL